MNPGQSGGQQILLRIGRWRFHPCLPRDFQEDVVDRTLEAAIVNAGEQEGQGSLLTLPVMPRNITS